ncbi:hypothetical protein FH972_025470 [Carpinus fangiana]|uniref:CPL domain-containing protein n=1 Tax=Carpinus fangiana TaxID=176857 RepID=A0A5N6L148_9ROSI|nr:hypothetical protein FH972_025470 [Carpinus fangiana]
MSAVKRKEPQSSGARETPAKKFKSDKGSEYKGKPKYDKSNGSAPKANRENIAPQKVFEAKGNSKEAHAAQRALAKERKLQKPNADSIQEAKKLWEKLRIKSKVPKEERQKMVADLFEIVTGRVQDFVFKHDSVRTVQCAVRYGSKEQQKQIAMELKGSYKDLAQSRYAKFLVGKLLSECDEDVQKMVVSEFRGSIRRLINHPEASWILDDTYRGVCTKAQKADLLCEWYGPEFAVFKDSRSDGDAPADLKSILDTNPEKRKPIMDHLHGMIDQLVQKKMTGFTMLHDAMLQYSLALGGPSESESANEFYQMLKPDADDEGGDDLLKNLAFTRSGARVVCRALAYSNAKDRKLLLRVFKDHIETMAYDPNAVCVLLATYECVDDTVMTSKLIFPDLLGTKIPSTEDRYTAVVNHMHDPAARMALLYPLLGFKLKVPEEKVDTHMHALVAEVQQLRATTSKKDAEVRRAELAKALTADGTLFDTIEDRADYLVKSTPGCIFITQLLMAAEGDKSRAMAAVAQLAAGSPAEAEHASKHQPTGKLLKTLVSGKRYDPVTKTAVVVEPRLGFADVLYPVIAEYVVEWACSGSSFVVLNMAEDEVLGERKVMLKTLKKGKKDIEKAAKTGNKGAELLLGKL